MVQLFGGLDNIYKNIDDPQIAKRTRELLVVDEGAARQSFRLAEIDRNVPLAVDWEKCVLADYKKEKVVKLFEELNFKSLILKLPSDSFEKNVVDAFI